MSEPHTENDPEAYHEAADKLTEDADRDVWVVESRSSSDKEWRVQAVLTSFEDAQEYMKDMRDFKENCSEDAYNQYCRNTVEFRYCSKETPNKLYEEWPPEEFQDGDFDE